MEAHREALRSGENPSPGPAVLVESARSTEVVLPRSAGNRPAWSTRPFTLSNTDAAAHKQARIERVMALQPLVADSSQVIDLVHAGRHQSPAICIGRAKRNDVIIHDPTVSSKHATIEESGSLKMLSDQGSSNGTYLNQERVLALTQEPLASGDCLRFGQRVFYYLTGERLLLFLELRIVKDRSSAATAG
jgi:hypothetical protein